MEPVTQNLLAVRCQDPALTPCSKTGPDLGMLMKVERMVTVNLGMENVVAEEVTGTMAENQVSGATEIVVDQIDEVVPPITEESYQELDLLHLQAMEMMIPNGLD